LTNLLTVNKNGSGTGTVTSSPAGINCGATCTTDNGSYDYNTDVTLTATPATGSQFAGWTGCTTSTGTTCHVTVTQATTVTAIFAPPLGCTTVKDAVDANCGGTQVADLGVIAGPACHDGCEAALAAANAATGCWVLAGDQHCYCRDAALVPGGGSSPGGTCQAARHAVTVTFAGDGTGTVASPVPAPRIDCGNGPVIGTTCSELFPSGSGNVTLTATPTVADGSAFAGWSGGCTNTSGTCTVSMTADVNVTATFVNPLTCDSTGGTGTGGTGAGCGGTTVATPTASNAGACRTQCGIRLAANAASSGCWLYQGTTCTCRDGQVTGTGTVAGLCHQ
jgi:hypothetical protein